MESIQHDGYTIRRATEADIPGFLDLHRTVFDTWPDAAARDTFAWKYEANPFFEELPVLVAVHDGDVVGAKGHFGLEMVVGDETLLGVQTGDLMVHPDHRRQGLLTRLVELDTALFDEGEQLFFGVPSSAATQGYLDAGRRQVENPLYVRPLAGRPPDGTARVSQWLRTTALKAYAGYRRVLERVYPTPGEFAVERRSEPPGESLVALYRQHVPRGIHATRDERFYRWRLADPLHDHTTYLARQDGEVAAGVVVSERDDDVVVREVVPFDPDPGPVRAILEAIGTDHADRARLSAWCPASLDPGVFLRSGFVPSSVLPRFPYATDLVVRGVGGDWEVGGVRIDDPESWAIQLMERDY